jgi:MerR family transcriptional regulator, heat shock protein HspR
VASASEGGRRRRAGKDQRRDRAYYMISVVARRFEVHPQTLRLYEREGLVTPSRTQGNTRLYSEEDLERLTLILNLTRDLGVNLAGVEIIMHLRQKIEAMQREMERFIGQVQEELGKRRHGEAIESSRALVKVPGHARVLKNEKR